MTRMIVALVLLWSASFAGTWRGTFTVPTTADSAACGARDAREIGPITAIFRVQRCDGFDSTFVMPPRMPGDTVNVDITAPDGHVYFAKVTTRDAANNVSCAFQQINFAFPAVAAPPPPPPPDTTGAFITGRYYAGRFRSTWIADRRDTTIDFAWGLGSPMPGVPADSFSVEWPNARLNIPTAGSWTMCLSCEDGGQLYVDATLRIDKLVVQPLTEWCATWNMVSGVHRLDVIYMANKGNSECHMTWAGPGVPKQIVPRTAFR